MQLKLPRLKLDERMLEFDNWVTPTLGEIKDTDKFVSERRSICQALDAFGERMRNFASLGDTSPLNIAESIIEYISERQEDESNALLLGVFSLLFLVTGKSDNNCKCQFPVYLRDELRWSSFPRLSKKNGETFLQESSLPRVLNDASIAKTVCSLAEFPKEQLKLLAKYTEFILNEEVYLKSFWALGNTYFRLKEDGLHEDFLMPMVIYRIRGSVSASAGHEPETILRERFVEWGLSPDIDFNTVDVVVGKQTENRKTKTRAYDFVLPYKTAGWEPRLFIQCQFYAGDSGSVSHKNVDQMRASRNFTKKKFSKPTFIEYVDGAGYFASLNGDLRRILDMRDTHSFFQVRTSVVKLRAALQEIGFLTPLEVVHAWSICNGSLRNMKNSLKKDGYKLSEIERVLNEGTRRGVFNIEQDSIKVAESLKETSRRYLLLDFIAVTGKKFRTTETKGTILVPGFGARFGISLTDIADAVLPKAGVFGRQWSTNGLVLKDIDFLAKRGWIEQR